MTVKSNERFLVMRNAGGAVGDLYDDAQDALNEAMSHENTGGAYVLSVHVPYRSDDESEPGDERDAYESWTNAELQAELRRRNLDSNGVKSAMVARLREHDEKRFSVQDETA